MQEYVSMASRLDSVICKESSFSALQTPAMRGAARMWDERGLDRLRAALAEIDFPCKERSKLIRGGLAPWQIRRVMTHIEANLHATIRIKDLAALIKLSSSHFSRLFRLSFDESPRGYVMRRRVDRAQGLMLTTDASLVRIAADCGLADQAHFNKVFRRFVGESPGAWRRARASAPAASPRPATPKDSSDP